MGEVTREMIKHIDESDRVIPIPDRHAWKHNELGNRPTFMLATKEMKPGSVSYDTAGNKYIIAVDGSMRRDGDWEVSKRKAIELGLRKKKYGTGGK